MPKLTIVDIEGEEHQLDAPVGRSVMQVSRENDVLGIEGECGGEMTCATCHVYVDENWLDELPPISPEEDDMLESVDVRKPTSRLGCQIVLSDALSGLRATVGQ